MTHIVITHYRPKRPPRKKAVTVEVPAIVRGKRAGAPEMTPAATALAAAVPDWPGGEET